MICRRTKLFLFLPAAMAFLLFAQTEYALAQNQACALDPQKFEALQKIRQDPTLDYLERIRQELAVRKDLLRDVVDCAEEEARSLEKKLEGVQSSDAGVKSLKSQHEGWLADVFSYYELQRGKIKDLGLQGSKDFAEDLAAWRAGNYKPAAALAENFIIWFQNHSLVQTAQSRLNQTVRAVQFFALEYNGDVSNARRAAEEEFRSAASAHRQAQDELRARSGQSLSSIKLTLEALARTYEKLFVLVEEINKALIGENSK